MVLSGRFNLSPNEKKRYKLDYTQQLAAGEIVNNAVFSVSSPTDPNNNGGCTVNGIAITPDGTQVTYFVSFSNPTAADGQVYNVVFEATTSLTQDFEDVVQYNVKAKVDP